MVDKKGGSSGGGAMPGDGKQKGKRPTATLELEAVEVKPEEETVSNNDADKEKPDGPEADEGLFSMPSLNSHVLASVIGGVVAALFFWLVFQISGPSGDGANADMVAQLTERLNKLDAQAKKDLKVQADEAFSKYEDKLNKIDKKIAAIAGAARAKDGKQISEAAAITSLLTDMEKSFVKKIDQLQGKFEAQIAERIRESSLELRRSFPIGAIANGQRGTEIVRKMVRDRTSDMSKNIDQMSRDFALVKEQNAQFRDKIRVYEGTVRDLNEQIKKLVSEVTVLREKAADQSQLKAAIAPVLNKVAALEGQLKKTERDSDLQKRSAENTALSLAFTGLKRATDQGAHFGAELEAFRKIAPELGGLKAVEAFQTKGIPTLRSLEQSFKALYPRVLRADAEPKTSSLWARFSANATSYLKFRRTGNIPGDSAEAIVARVEYYLKKGQYDKALKNGKGLSGGALKEALPWLEQLQARLALEQALQKIELRLMSRLSSTQGDGGRAVH